MPAGTAAVAGTNPVADAVYQAGAKFMVWLQKEKAAKERLKQKEKKRRTA